MKLKLWQFLFLCILSMQTIVVFAQVKTCGIRLNVFSARKTEYPLDSPIKNASATIVNLSDNKIVTAQAVEANPFFPNLSQGNYNIVTVKDGYVKTSKYLRLDCAIVDEKKVFDEIIMMGKGDSNESARMSSADLDIAQSPPPPPPPGSSPKEFELGKKSVNSGFLNERAVYLPTPNLSAEGSETNDSYKTTKGNFYVKVFVIGDATGKVTDAFYENDNRWDKKLFPDILEKAKQAKFLPFKINGQPAGFAGSIIYTF